VVQAQDQAPVVGVARGRFRVFGQSQIGQAGDGKAGIPAGKHFPGPGNPHLTTGLFRPKKERGKARFLAAGFAEPENLGLKALYDPGQAVKMVGMGMGEDDLVHPPDLLVPEKWRDHPFPHVEKAGGRSAPVDEDDLAVCLFHDRSAAVSHSQKRDLHRVVVRFRQPGVAGKQQGEAGKHGQKGERSPVAEDQEQERVGKN